MKYKIRYEGDLRTTCTHEQSGVNIQTDAPIDNQGMGRFFSPTDLTAASLAACMITIIGITAQNHAVNIEAMEASVAKHMADSPRRIGKIEIQLTVKSDADERTRSILDVAARRCPVALSLHPDIVQDVKINFSR